MKIAVIAHNKTVFITQLALFSFCILCLVWVGAYFYKSYIHFILKRKLKKRFKHAKGGELSAEKLLQQMGYTLLDLQKSSTLSMWVNGEKFSYLVRPDAFAQKEGKRYLVEVKTGAIASDPTKSATRRQLLEYYHGFDVDGVLLVDAEMQEVHDIYFETKTEKEKVVEVQKILSKKAFLAAFLGGVIVTLLIVYYNLK